MAENNLHKYFLSIVLPSILAIGLFILSIYVIIMPSFERAIMDKKKEMISELTNTAWSLLEEYENEYQQGNLSREEAQKTAISRISEVRYGSELKDYFWIIDQHPKMIMHPYRGELINRDLTDYEDPNGKKLFVEAAKIVKEKEDGFIDYMWQWKDDSSLIVPKLSYVKGFQPWGWIIGTGIYLEDVKEEINVLRKRLLRISLIITLIITTFLLFVMRQSLIIEYKRRKAASELLLSKQKYKSLVEASTEGTLMILNQKIIFSNLKFGNLSGYDTTEILSLTFKDIFNIKWEQVISSFDDPKKSLTLESKIKCKDNSEKDIVISVSKVKYAEDDGYIIITREVTRQKQIEVETEHLSQELQTSLLLMNQPIKHFVHQIIMCDVDTSIYQAVKFMSRKNSSALFIHKGDGIIGIINDSDLKNRVLAENFNTQKSVMDIMTAPVITLPENSLLYEAVLLFKNKNISHLGVKNEEGRIIGVISYKDIAEMQQNALSYLIKEIELAENIDQLKKIHNRVPVLVNALIESGDKTANITRIITSVSDSIAQRLINLTIEELGKPPCEFAFMVMGSEGRMEQTLLTDQDNAIIFDDIENEQLEKASNYFQRLGKKVTQSLNQVGYRLCKGDVMASNQKWAQPWSVWKEYFTGWISTSDPKSIMEATIFFDFRCVFGKENLVTNLRNHVNQTIENKAVFFYHLAQSVIKFKPPISLFGNIIGKDTNKDEINLDIKKILMPITGFIRLYALFNMISETNSLFRIKQLYVQKIIDKFMYEELALSYNYLMQMRFRFQAKSIMNNDIPDNIIDINKLTHIEIATLKKIFTEIGNLQTKVNFDFKGSA